MERITTKSTSNYVKFSYGCSSVYEEYWKHPPFGAEMEENGDIYARGSQDTKNIGTQYLAAIRALKRQNVYQLKRTVYIVFVPDEEMGGMLGMQAFSNS